MTRYRIVSWNVNGVRAALKKELLAALHSLQADIVCLQEIKAQPEQVDLPLKGYEILWNPAEKKGYSGTLTAARHPHLSSMRGLGRLSEDCEGRVLTCEFAPFFVVNVYTPNSQRGLLRLDYRSKVWDPAFLAYLEQLLKIKPVVVCGDLNVAHEEIDLANPKQNRKNAGFTDEERAGFSRILAAGFIDTFREFEAGPGFYTWWTPRNNARERNIGWRIDYIIVSKHLREHLAAAKIHQNILGSDHCPVSIDLVF